MTYIIRIMRRWTVRRVAVLKDSYQSDEFADFAKLKGLQLRGFGA